LYGGPSARLRSGATQASAPKCGAPSRAPPGSPVAGLPGG